MEIKDFNAIRISLASPDEIRSWSYGEVTKPETINYRRLRPERDGLFCEAIFGPTKDWQCYCGKYKKVRFKGIVCDKCGVEVTRSSVRRERMGHIDLAAPVAHIWYTRRVPSYLGLLLNISRRNLDRVLYFAQYIVTNVDEKARERALKRIEDELEDEIQKLRHQTAEQMAEFERAAQSRTDELREELNEEVKELEATRDERVDEIMGAAADMREYLNSEKDKAAPEDIVFKPLDRVIVEEDEVIGSENITELNGLVEEELNKIEAVFEQEKEDKELLITSQIDQINQETEDRKQEMSDDLGGRIEEIRASRDDEREELHNLHVGMFLNESEYRDYYVKYGHIFEAGMGAEALLEIVKDIDLDSLAKELRREIRQTRSKQRRKKATKRLKVVEGLRRSNNKPEWTTLEVLPVIPPDLRPMVQLDGGRFATSDLNDLYRRVINRNNRLKRLLELEAPDVIIRNEKRMLQESVDSLIDNSRRGKAVSLRGKRKLKSLSDMLKGKQGRFRRNLLGKRVDYSGRSVIVVGPKLKMHQCGLPKKMALELFKPFIIHQLVEENYAPNVKGAKRIIEQSRPEVWGVLEKVIKGRPVLLNRAPTLHRLGIQAFEPVLTEGDAIELHPSVCAAFNADFDGDQMAVHVPLSDMAVKESYNLMLSSRNLLKPANGEPTVSPTKDMVLGIYYLTMDPNPEAKGAGRVFGSPDEAMYAHELGQVDLHALIKVRLHRWFDDIPIEDLELSPRVMSVLQDFDLHTAGDIVDIMRDGTDQLLDIPNFGRVSLQEVEEAIDMINPDQYAKRGELVETSIGRLIFNDIIPNELGYYNEVLDKGGVRELVAEAYKKLGIERTAIFADELKDIGFEYATKSGVTIAIDDVTVPADKSRILADVEGEVEGVEQQYRRGLITAEEQYRKTVELWTKAKDDVSDAVAETLDKRGPIAVMANSGATKGGYGPVSQLAGMRGLMADPSGRIIPLPIRSNFREGLTALEYFISTHGARKGLADTALRTADAGYLTRRLVDVAQDVIIQEEDCGSREGLLVNKKDARYMQEDFRERLFGRYTADKVVDPETGEILLDANEYIDERMARRIVRRGITEVEIRSSLGCRLRRGICVKCYGRDMGRGGMIPIGEAVGVIAAQSIGEPGTQLTLRTFHTGGVAGGEDITQGLPRVQELFEARSPKGEAILSEIGGRIEIDREGDLRMVRVINATAAREDVEVSDDFDILVEEGDLVKRGDVLAKGPDDATIEAPHEGTVLLENGHIVIRYDEREVQEYDIPPTSRLRVSEGDIIEAGHQITEGAKNPHQVLKIQGREAVQDYLMREIQRVYNSQGVGIHDKHVEIIVRQMLRKVRILHSGDTNYLRGDLVDRLELEAVNEQLIARGMEPAAAEQLLLGITKAALNTESFLSSASFQHTISVLSEAAIESKIDPLYGLKENVIIGKLIPAGTGYRARRKREEERAEREEELAAIEEKIRKERELEEEDLGDLDLDDFDDLDDLDDLDDIDFEDLEDLDDLDFDLADLDGDELEDDEDEDEDDLEEDEDEILVEEEEDLELLDEDLDEDLDEEFARLNEELAAELEEDGIDEDEFDDLEIEEDDLDFDLEEDVDLDGDEVEDAEEEQEEA